MYQQGQPQMIRMQQNPQNISLQHGQPGTPIQIPQPGTPLSQGHNQQIRHQQMNRPGSGVNPNQIINSNVYQQNQQIGNPRTPQMQHSGPQQQTFHPQQQAHHQQFNMVQQRNPQGQPRSPMGVYPNIHNQHSIKQQIPNPSSVGPMSNQPRTPQSIINPGSNAPASNQGVNMNPSSNQGINMNPSSNQGINMNPSSNQGINMNPSSNQGINMNPPSNQGINMNPSSNQPMNMNPASNQGANLSIPSNQPMSVNPSSNQSLNMNPASNQPMSNQPMSNQPMSNQPMSNQPMSNQQLNLGNCLSQPVNMSGQNESILNIGPGSHQGVFRPLHSMMNPIKHANSPGGNIYQRQHQDYTPMKNDENRGDIFDPENRVPQNIPPRRKPDDLPPIGYPNPSSYEYITTDPIQCIKSAILKDLRLALKAVNDTCGKLVEVRLSEAKQASESGNEIEPPSIEEQYKFEPIGENSACEMIRVDPTMSPECQEAHSKYVDAMNDFFVVIDRIESHINVIHEAVKQQNRLDRMISSDLKNGGQIDKEGQDYLQQGQNYAEYMVSMKGAINDSILVVNNLLKDLRSAKIK
uniref:Mediator complex subunit 29 n=1 Tax=Parastrongyloides trichosuri TaxID=131310 RepID=A0A0N4ZEK0_PARTI